MDNPKAMDKPKVQLIQTGNNVFYKISKLRVYVVCAFLVLLSIWPFWLVIVNATRTTAQIQDSLSLIPSTHLLSNFRIVDELGMNLGRGFYNSLFIATTSTVMAIYCSAMVAYGFKVYKFKGHGRLYLFVIAVLMLPPQVTMIGFYQFMLEIGLTNSFIPLILPAVASPTSVFFMKQYLDSTLKMDLVNAARIDGANEFRIFNTIVLPMMRPALGAMGIILFVISWNNFLMPLMLISEKNKNTLPIIIQQLQGEIYRTEYGAVYLILAISIVPILVAFIAFSRQMISGIALGGLKE